MDAAGQPAPAISDEALAEGLARVCGDGKSAAGAPPSVPSVRPAASLSYEAFFREHLLANAPLLVTGALEAWGWPKQGVSDLVELAASAACAGTVAHCGARELSDQRREECAAADFLQRLAEGRCGEGEYLKDCHLAQALERSGARGREGGRGATFYVRPPLFADDWMDDFWRWRDDVDDDFRFVYAGGRGTWTPVHVDVFGSYSWSANVEGRKLWYLVPPSASAFLRDRWDRDVVYDLRPHLLAAPRSGGDGGGGGDKAGGPRVRALPPGCLRSSDAFPRLHLAEVFEVLQLEGECIFVPSQWHHMVVNLGEGPTLSVNHNWGNAANLLRMMEHLEREERRVRRELEHCSGADDFPDIVQRVLRALAGTDRREFDRYLDFAERRARAAEADAARCEEERNVHRFTLACIAAARARGGPGPGFIGGE